MRCAKSPEFVRIAREHFNYQTLCLYPFILLIGAGTKSGDFAKQLLQIPEIKIYNSTDKSSLPKVCSAFSIFKRCSALGFLCPEA